MARCKTKIRENRTKTAESAKLYVLKKKYFVFSIKSYMYISMSVCFFAKFFYIQTICCYRSLELLLA